MNKENRGIYPRISVVMTAYNGECFIAETLDSVLAQQYPAHEIIVIDDGSTDGTPQILGNYEGRIKSKSIRNQGAANATNVGLKMVTGEFVAFLDQDDLWFKDYLKVQAAAICTYPEAGFFCCDFACRYGRNGYRMRKHFSGLRYLREINFDQPLIVDPFRLLIKENIVGATASVIIRKDVIDAVGDFDVESLTEDYDYWLRCALKTKFVIQSKVLMYKRTHDSNVSSNEVIMCTHHKKVLMKTLQNERAYIEEHKLINELKSVLAENNYRLGNAQYEVGNIKKAFRLYLEGMFMYVTLSNLFLFLSTVSKKFIRLITFNKLSKANFKLMLRKIKFSSFKRAH